MSREELMYLVLQHFEEEGLTETAHTFGRESGFYFDYKHFEDLVLKGKWDEVEKYLSGFINVEENDHSIKIFFELRKQKYFEALDRKDRMNALDILMNDLKTFKSRSEETFKDLTQLLTLNNMREHKTLAAYRDATTGRMTVLNTIKPIIEQNPKLDGKLKVPAAMKNQKLKNIIIDRLKSQNLISVPAAPEPGLFMNAYHSRPSISASVIQGTNLNNHGVPSENSKGVVHISSPSQCHMLLLPPHSEGNKIVRLAYTNAGNGAVALTSNGTHLVWIWPPTANDMDAKATTQVSPQLWHPKNNLEFMTNDLKNVNGEDVGSCFDISKRDSYLISTSGGVTTLFNMVTFKALGPVLVPPPMVTYLAFYPEDNNKFAVAYEDNTILIINLRDDGDRIKLEGHSKRVTSFAFSNTLNLFVSADASAQIIVWNSKSWKKLSEKKLQMNGATVPQTLSETQIQFHPDQKKFLVVHYNHLGIYEATELKCVNQWDQKIETVISKATFSSNGQMVYASFAHGTLAIFDASNFQMHYMIHPSIFSSISSVKIYPTAIAAHPQKPNQFAAGFTDGSVYVFEPKEASGNWIMPAQVDKETHESMNMSP